MSTTDLPDPAAGSLLGAPHERRFADFPLSPSVLKGLSDLGYTFATSIQAAAIEPMLAGRDLLVRASVRSGGIGAFAIPLVERVTEGARAPLALVITPAPKRARKICDEIATLSRYRDVNLCLLVDGLAVGPQEEQLALGCEIAIGTPGRVLEHIARGRLDLSALQMLVVDDIGALSAEGLRDVAVILGVAPPGRQLVMLSGDLPEDARAFAESYLADPERIEESPTASSRSHAIYLTASDQPDPWDLLRLIDAEDPPTAVVFCNSQRDAVSIAAFLDHQGIDTQILPADAPQSRRASAVQRLREGDLRVIVSTDQAARDIDFSDVSCVICYQMPTEPEVYLRRVNRDHRSRRSARVICLASPLDAPLLDALSSRHGSVFERRVLPDPDAATSRRVERQSRQMRDIVGSFVSESYLPTARALLQHPDADTLVAAALRTLFQWDRRRRATMSEIDTGGEPFNRKARPERKGKPPKSERSRPEKDRRRPKQRNAEREEPEASSLQGDPQEDDLLIEAAEESEAKSTAPQSAGEESSRKKKRRRRKRGKSDGEGADRAGETDGEGDEPYTPGTESFDDLDALLSAD